jgi:hypothetical protein
LKAGQDAKVGYADRIAGLSPLFKALILLAFHDALAIFFARRNAPAALSANSLCPELGQRSDRSAPEKR